MCDFNLNSIDMMDFNEKEAILKELFYKGVGKMNELIWKLNEVKEI